MEAIEKKEWKKKIDEILIKQKKYRDPDYSAQQLADDLGLQNLCQLSRRLSKAYGKSYSDIILPLRIKDAKRYLVSKRKCTWNVEDIGILVGFRNKWSFFQAFRKFAGCTPADYKSKCLGTPLVDERKQVKNHKNK